MITNSAVPVPTQPTGLIPLQRVKTYKAGPDLAEKLRADVTGCGLNEIREVLVAVTGQQIGEQLVINNPPAFANVDGVRGRGIAQAQRKVTVSFGVRLKREALNALTNALTLAIARSTTERSGRLANMGNWLYRYVRNGKTEPLPVAGASGIPMGPRDFITLMPLQVVNGKRQAYATAVNMRVAGGGRLSYRRTANGRVARRNQSIGFLALASRAAAGSPLFDGFTVTVGFTSKHALPGEVVHAGGPYRTGYIVIRPKTGK